MSIHLEGVRKQFGTTVALDGISLDIQEGEFFVVLGPSGCGKSTLLRVIAGLESVDSGIVQLAGRQVSGGSSHVPPEERQCAVVFQSYALWPHMSVREHAQFPLDVEGMSVARRKERCDDALAAVQLTEFAERRPDALSGGQRQRVALARCLAQGANVLLMDEPLANLDPHLRASMETELASLQRNMGATLFYITHDQREAMALADRIAIMEAGRVLQVDTPENLYRRPDSTTVARFVGEGTLLEARCVGGWSDGAVRVDINGIALDVAAPEKCRTGPVTVLYRPEELILEHVTEVSGNALDASVLACAYRGGYHDVHAKSANGQLLRVRTTIGCDVGEQIRVGFSGGWVVG